MKAVISALFVAAIATTAVQTVSAESLDVSEDRTQVTSRSVDGKQPARPVQAGRTTDLMQLTPEQREQMRQIREEAQAAHEKIRAEVDAKVKAVLSPEQYAVYKDRREPRGGFPRRQGRED